MMISPWEDLICKMTSLVVQEFEKVEMPSWELPYAVTGDRDQDSDGGDDKGGSSAAAVKSQVR